MRNKKNDTRCISLVAFSLIVLLLSAMLSGCGDSEDKKGSMEPSVTDGASGSPTGELSISPTQEPIPTEVPKQTYLSQKTHVYSYGYKTVTDYDENGHILLEEEYRSESETPDAHSTYEYDGDSIVKVLTYDEGELNYTLYFDACGENICVEYSEGFQQMQGLPNSEIELNDEGRPVKLTTPHRGGDSVIYEESIFEYDDLGRLIGKSTTLYNRTETQQITYNGEYRESHTTWLKEGDYESTTVITYNEKGLPVLQKTENSEGTSTVLYTWKYDEEYNCIEERFVNQYADGRETLLSHATRTINEKQQLVQEIRGETTDGEDGGYVNWVTDYYYDEAGKLTHTEFSRLEREDEEPTLLTRTEYTYNEDGLILKEETKNLEDPDGRYSQPEVVTYIYVTK